MTFAEKLASLMRDRDLKAGDMVAGDCGVSESTIRWWLNRDNPRHPDIEQLKKIARFFNVSVAYLADEEIDRPKPEPRRISGMAGFGMIHELADLEVKVRRSLQTAKHNLDCATQLMETVMLENNGSLTEAQQEDIRLMVLRASSAVDDVIGG